MFYHVRLTFGDSTEDFWNLSHQEVIERVLIPFIHGQVVPIYDGHALLSMKAAPLLEVWATSEEIDRTEVWRKIDFEGKNFTRYFPEYFDAVSCTQELIGDLKSLQAGPTLTSVFQKAFASSRNQVFVIMKFNDKVLNSAYDGVIQPVIEKFGMQPLRIDEVQNSGKITDQVLESIACSRYILADLSGERPNCYYEAGFAHALGKELILSIRKADKIHFDLAGYRFIQWETEADLRRELIKRFTSLTSSCSL
jgi:hypothetical protein